MISLSLLISPCSAGIVGFGANPAMTSAEYYRDYKIPWFDNRQSAVIWAHKNHAEPVRRLLKRRMRELMAEAQKTSGNLDPLMLKKTAYFMAEWDDCRVALKIIEGYKKNGASVYAGSVPVEGYNGTPK